MPVLICQDKIKELGMSVFSLQQDSGRETKVADIRWKRIVRPVFFWIPINHFSFQSPLEHVPSFQTKQSVQHPVEAHRISEFFESVRQFPIDGCA